MIPYGKQEILKEDIDSVAEVLQSPLITQGPKAIELEEKIATKVDAKYAVSFNSATSALHCAVLALGLREGEWLWTTPISFVASSNCGLYCGAKVDFVDIDKKTYNLSVELLEEKLKRTKKHKLPKVLVAVHFGGQSCDMEKIWELSKKYGKSEPSGLRKTTCFPNSLAHITTWLRSDLAILRFLVFIL